MENVGVVKINSIKDIFKEEVLGFSESDNIQDFPGQGISDNQIECVDSSSWRESKFKPNKVIFFDSTARLDFVLMTRSSVIGFTTFSLGYIEVEYKKPIRLCISESIKYKVIRKIILPQFSLKDDIYHTSITLSQGVGYEIHRVSSPIPTVEELWEKIVLEELIPKLEREYIANEVLKVLGKDDILIKDGRLEDLGSNPNVFGHVKNFEINREVVYDNNLLIDKRSSIYRIKDNTYSCYINLGLFRGDKGILLDRGTFNYSRVDMNIDNFDDSIVDRFNFISEYLLNLTSVFSDSPRFPQNIPVIESLENVLRHLSGDRSIVKHQIIKSLK